MTNIYENSGNTFDLSGSGPALTVAGGVGVLACSPTVVRGDRMIVHDRPPDVECTREGEGEGRGNGSGSGLGSCYGWGDGTGSGEGYGYGDGSGSGRGYGDGWGGDTGWKVIS